MKRIGILGLALSILLSGGLRADSLETLGGTVKDGLSGWPEQGPLPLASGAKLPRADFVMWKAGTVMTARPGQMQVILANGCSLRGRISEWGDEDITLKTRLFGDRKVAYEDLWAILFLDNAVSLPLQQRLTAKLEEIDTDDNDALVLETDVVEGVLDVVEDGKVYFDIDGEMKNFRLSQVSAVRLAGKLQAPAGKMSLTTRGGSTFYVDKLVWGDKFKLTTALGEFTIDRAEVASIRANNAKHRSLVTMKPSKVEESLPGREIPGSYPYAYQVNRSNYFRRPLNLDGRHVPVGLGVHADSRLTWQLPEGMVSLSGACGLEAMAQGEGSVHFRIYGDGKKLFDSRLMTGADKAQQFRVDLKGVRQLVLECVTDPGLEDDSLKSATLDRAVWAGLTLLSE